MNGKNFKKSIILIIDSSPADVEILSGFLIDAGFEVLVAEDSRSALQQAESALPDLILLNVPMPEIEGFEICHCLKQQGSTQTIPVIFVTTMTEMDRVRSLDAGAADYLVKPLQRGEVLARVGTQLHIRSLTQQLREQNTRLEQEGEERKRSQAALRRSEERFQLITRATNDAVWDWDLQTNQVWWNEEIQTLFGYTAKEVGTELAWWHDQIHPDDRERVMSGLYATIRRAETDRTEAYWSEEYRYRRADGSYADVADQGYLVRAADGRPVRMLGGMSDVTERKHSQEELQRQNHRTQLFAEVTLKIRQSLQIQEILQTAVTEVRKILDADRVLVYRLWANGTGSSVAEEVLPGFSSVTGYTFPEEVFPEESRHLYLRGRVGLISDVENNRTIAPCLVDYLRQFQVKAKLVVPIIAKGELWGLLVAHQCQYPRQWVDAETDLLQHLADQIAIGLTQAQLLEQETRQRQELVRSNTELQQFAYIASHDLQEPLRMITSYLQLLERRYKGRLDADADDFITFAVDGAARMKTLIDDLLAYSRVDTRGQSFKAVDCSMVVEQAIANLKVAIEESNAAVTYTALPEVMGDPSQLSQLFQNLISNAIKFRSEAAPLVQIAAEPREQHWLFSVRDNGIGMESQYVERVFVIFQRLHNRTRYPGTGIGLAICKKIVERHGGQIWVESEPSQGSTFYFTLPKQEEPHREI